MSGCVTARDPSQPLTAEEKAQEQRLDALRAQAKAADPLYRRLIAQAILRDYRHGRYSVFKIVERHYTDTSISGPNVYHNWLAGDQVVYCVKGQVTPEILTYGLQSGFTFTVVQRGPAVRVVGKPGGNTSACRLPYGPYPELN